MTIKYLDSKRINGLSTDIVETVTFSDDFSGADSWTDTGTLTGVNISTDVIDWSGVRDNVNQSTSFDLTTVSDTVFSLRFKLTISAISGGTVDSSHFVFMGLSSTAGSSISSSARDFIGLAIRRRVNGTNDFRAIDGDGISWDDTGAVASPDATFSTVPSATTYYIEIKRTSATVYTINIYSNSAYTTLTETKSGVCVATNSSLRYILIQNYKESVETSSFNGTIDDIQFWNGVSLHNKPDSTTVQTNSLFTETDTGKILWSGNGWATFSDDFTSYTTQALADASWVSDDTTNQRVNITDDNLFSNNNGASTIQKVIYYDLTSTSDTAWVLRFKSTLGSFTARTDTNTQHTNVTISSSNAPSDTVSDWMGLTWNTHTGLGNIYDVGGKDNTGISQFNGTYFTKTLVNGETIYVELKRNGADITANLFSDANYTTLIETRTKTTTGTITSLRYLKVTIRRTVTTSNGIINLLLDDFKFWNGVSSV